MASISITWTESSIKKVENTSVVHVTARLSPASSDNACVGWITIGGVTAVNEWGEQVSGIYVGNGAAFSGSLTVKHNPDGSLNDLEIRASVSADDYGLVSGYKSVKLQKIDRNTPITRANETSFGGACSVEFKPLTSDVYYKVKFGIGTWSGESPIFKPGTTNAYIYSGYTIPLEAANQVTDRMKAIMTVTLYSYEDSGGNTLIGDPSTSQFPISVPSTMIPSLSSASASVINTNPVINGWGIPLTGFSKVNVKAVGAGIYGSEIQKYTITGGYVRNVVGKTLDYTGGSIQVSGDISFTITCTDTRGAVSEPKLINPITFLPYYPPSITMFTADKDSNGNAVLSFLWDNGGSSNPIANLNTCTGVVKYRISGRDKDTWYSLGEVANGGDLVTNIKPDELTSYVFRLTVSDLAGVITEKDAYLSTAKVLLDFKAGGNGLGIGKICENDRMEVAMEAEFDGVVKIREVPLDEYIRMIMPVLHESMYGDDEPPTDGKPGQIYFQRVNRG